MEVSCRGEGLAAVFWDMKKRLGILAGISVVLVLACVLGSVYQARGAFGSGMSQPPIGKDAGLDYFASA